MKTAKTTAVSIPFIAGQWSLPTMPGRVPYTHATSFNPLHCGAVVASAAWSRQVGLHAMFQSPSLRGSGRFAAVVYKERRNRVFVSIPFIAGQWSLRLRSDADRLRKGLGLNPLHCGAVVASGAGPASPEPAGGLNPLHCGAVVASRRLGPRFGRRSKSFNPLHCGAVVASFIFISPIIVYLACFNPLHCGAVVASKRQGIPSVHTRCVSIPFIAGQWSLPVGRSQWGSAGLHVSIPFIAGQWSLRSGFFLFLNYAGRFQSPSLRGSGRFRRDPFYWALNWFLEFQSPSLRGSGRFTDTPKEGDVGF